jgi:hypothetical protein
MPNSVQPAPGLLSTRQDDLRFFSNACKDDRERWIFDNWCSLTGRNSAQGIKSEAPDFTLNGKKIEIVEVLEAGRKRHKEFKDVMATLSPGSSQSADLIHDGPDLDKIKSSAHQWVLDAIRDKHNHYGSSAASWTLLVYADFTFANRTDWQAVTTELSRTPPGFARIEVLLPDGTRSMVLHPALPPHQV